MSQQATAWLRVQSKMSYDSYMNRRAMAMKLTRRYTREWYAMRITLKRAYASRRREQVRTARAVIADDHVHVIWQTTPFMRNGLLLYNARRRERAADAMPQAAYIT